MEAPHRYITDTVRQLNSKYLFSQLNNMELMCMFSCGLEGILRAPNVVKKPEEAKNIGYGQKVGKKMENSPILCS